MDRLAVQMVRPDLVRGHRPSPGRGAAVFEDEPHHEARHCAARLVGKQAPRRARPSAARRPNGPKRVN